jgi:hypothetical protein
MLMYGLYAAPGKADFCSATTTSSFSWFWGGPAKGYDLLMCNCSNQKIGEMA